MKHHYHKAIPKLNIRKASGVTQPYSELKLKRSFKRCGLKSKDCDRILNEIRPQIKKGISTKEIFQKSYQLISKASRVAATNYSLKRALFALGPTGHKFEDFIAKFLQHQNYQTQVRVVLDGQTVKHEVDVLAHKDHFTNIIECKFHNHQGTKNDIKLVLYLKARMDDLRSGKHAYKLNELWIASNTSFTTDAQAYAKFHHIKLLGTNSPSEENLLDVIKRLKLYPITSLKRLKKIHATQLIEKNIILVHELAKNEVTMRRVGMTNSEIDTILKDITILLSENA